MYILCNFRNYFLYLFFTVHSFQAIFWFFSFYSMLQYKSSIKRATNLFLQPEKRHHQFYCIYYCYCIDFKVDFIVWCKKLRWIIVSFNFFFLIQQRFNWNSYLFQWMMQKYNTRLIVETDLLHIFLKITAIENYKDANLEIQCNELKYKICKIFESTLSRALIKMLNLEYSCLIEFFILAITVMYNFFSTHNIIVRNIH